mmetsp:Transcript_1555/g.1987  ORF Transcript_1555/g.1987 Transcript_1555/m.1987 type:complete len:105 (-) Transcript_1555:68-382(-)
MEWATAASTRRYTVTNPTRARVWKMMAGKRRRGGEERAALPVGKARWMRDEKRMERRKEKADVVTTIVSWAFLWVRRKRRDSVGEKAISAQPIIKAVLVMSCGY